MFSNFPRILKSINRNDYKKMITFFLTSKTNRGNTLNLRISSKIINSFKAIKSNRCL